MSSSRVHTSFTGMPPACLEIATASTMKSLERRRPKPPPQRIMCSVTLSRVDADRGLDHGRRPSRGSGSAPRSRPCRQPSRGPCSSAARAERGRGRDRRRTPRRSSRRRCSAASASRRLLADGWRPGRPLASAAAWLSKLAVDCVAVAPSSHWILQLLARLPWRSTSRRRRRRRRRAGPSGLCRPA